ncbi:MAG TPA: ATP-binding protein [Selenomonadales bacterium]|nr:ATP-binding protein [Selenomonadales bacterium]
MSVFQKAQRRKAKLKLALCGPSGSGKTYSALKIAKGMGGKIAFIDTENGSGQLYAHVADYDVAEIGPPFAVEKYISAIKAAEEAGYNILIIDSLSHAWAKQGGILDEVDKRGGRNAFTSGWREATPMHDRFVDAILQSPLHIIVTMRAKTAYELEKDDKGKTVPVKKGMEPVQRAGLEYEFTVVLDMDNARHTATSGKDRTGMFDGKCFVPDETTGTTLMQWLETGIEAQPQYYQPQYQQQFYQQPAAAPCYSAPAEPVQAAPVYGFPAHETEIVYYMTTVWGNLANFDIAGYIQRRPDFSGRLPAQLTVEECYALKNEFAAYAAQKNGGNNA